MYWNNPSTTALASKVPPHAILDDIGLHNRCHRSTSKTMQNYKTTPLHYSTHFPCTHLHEEPRPTCPYNSLGIIGCCRDGRILIATTATTPAVWWILPLSYRWEHGKKVGPYQERCISWWEWRSQGSWFGYVAGGKRRLGLSWRLSFWQLNIRLSIEK